MRFTWDVRIVDVSGKDREEPRRPSPNLERADRLDRDHRRIYEQNNIIL